METVRKKRAMNTHHGNLLLRKCLKDTQIKTTEGLIQSHQDYIALRFFLSYNFFGGGE